ncbi:hypothetical protein EDD17DRAFT_1544839 [Pisolithus thermaeus]|nr:hypothetical protein EDD17DRAFT_1544839 [Pisolithus thermaeus]
MRLGQESSLPTTTGERHLKVEDVQEAFVERKDRLLTGLDTVQRLLGDVRDFNKNKWVVRYPTLQETDSNSETSTSRRSRRSIRRSLSFADDPDSQTDVIYTPSHNGLVRSESAEFLDGSRVVTDDDRLLPSKCGDFSILRLDLKLGPSGSSTSPTALVSHLERASIAKLLDERIGSAIQHMEKLRLRITDTSSKVLVTGDLNAGKSTFVNALLRREVMPVDQQPCTTAFCEVHGASENDGVEEVHVLKQGVTYSASDEFDLHSRLPSESLLNNGVVDISLIDAPGLNRDSLKTTALFARQEEIDVVVFVVSAENHFTLSAKEFLGTASNEKAYVFIVVNKFEQIKNKDKCKRLVLEQIKELSPRTHDDAADLVHFSSLRSFVLVKRSKSKLQPVSTFLSNLLSEVDLLAGTNAIVAQSDVDRAKDDLLRSKPVWEKMKNSREALEDALESVEETGASKSQERTKAILSTALDRVGQGQPGVDHCLSLPAYRGLLRIWDYARDVRKVLLTSLDAAVKMAEEEARSTTKAGVTKITDLGNEHLPQGVERSRRVFVPEAMFNAHAVVAGGVYNLGIGLAQRSDMLDTSFSDVFDFNHHLALHFGGGEGDDNESNPTALSVLSVGVSALTMVSGKVIGARGLIDGAIRISDLSANETARTWVAPVIGAVVVGATAYFIYRLPDTIPKTIGRRIRASLLKVEENTTEAETFINAHAGRVSRETRKVLRLASWDLRERFRVAMEERGREVREAEELERNARNALQFFHEVERRSGVVRKEAGLVGS